MRQVYLDHAAATPLDVSVLERMQPFFSEYFHNPSALYSGARTTKDALESARAKVAQTLGCRSSEVIFTAGGTESANMAIHGVLGALPDAHAVASAVEHDAVTRPVTQYNHTICPVDKKGLVDTDELERSITDDTVLVSVMYASNEVGTVQPIKDVAHTVSTIRAARKEAGHDVPLYLHVDACQAPLYLDCNVTRIGADLMTLNGGKIHGPKQSGVLYVRAGIELRPLLQGGGQEQGLRSGTEHVAAAVGFAHAFEQAQTKRKDTAEAVSQLARWFANELTEKYGAILNGHEKRRLPNNVHVTFPGHDNERMLFALDEVGVSAAAGSACSASSDEVSRVLLAMGVSEADARASLRFTIGRGTNKGDLLYVLSVLDDALAA